MIVSYLLTICGSLIIIIGAAVLIIAKHGHKKDTQMSIFFV